MEYSFTRLYLFINGVTYTMDDFGNAIEVTFDNLGSASFYVHSE